MKKLYFILIVFSLSSNVTKAQDTTSVQGRIKIADNLKTGNWLDVFTNFFQVGATDLTGQDKSFDFKSTLFALLLKTDPSLNVDTNYVKHKIDRNLQFNVSLKLDQKFQFTGFSGGLTWAVVNKRDSTILNFANNPLNVDFKKFSDSLNTEMDRLYARLTHHDTLKRKRVYNSTEDSLLYAQVYKATDTILFASDTSLIEIFPAVVQNIVRTYISALSSAEYTSYISAYRAALAACRLKPLLTISLNGVIDSGGKLNQGIFQAVYLQGLPKNKLEVDLRANLITKDTLLTTETYRTTFSFTGGINWSVSKNRTGASVLEFKPYVEYDRVLGGMLPNEKTSAFFADADIRLRVTDNLWIPLTIKYDIQHANVLGILNVALNLDALKNANKKR